MTGLPRLPRLFLVIGGLYSLTRMLLHIFIALAGTGNAVSLFGGGWLAVMAEGGGLIPMPALLIAAGLYLIAGVYAFSGAKLIRRLPLCTAVLMVVSVLYLVRGSYRLGLVIYIVISAGHAVPLDLLVFCFAPFVIGVVHLFGTLEMWPHLRARPRVV